MTSPLLKSRFDFSTADGAFVVDRTGRILLWNEAAERITGKTRSQVIGRPCCDVFEGRDGLGNLLCFQGCQVQQMARRGEPPTHRDMRVPHGDGRELWLDVSTVLIHDDNGELEAAAHIFRDVTARRELEQYLRSSLGEHDKKPYAATGGAAALDSLTRREREILRLMASGLPTHTIAHKLSISRATVRNHTQNILNKLGVHSKLAAVALAHTEGLMDRGS
jgi:PAS domain S-box-containing protein